MLKRVLRSGPNANGDASDLVKRRYSTRFNQLPDFSNAGAPPVPSLPAPQRRSRGPSPSAPKVNIDVNVLRDPNLVADQCKLLVNQKGQLFPWLTRKPDSNHVLTDATDQDLRDFQSNLRRVKNRASTDLQQNVYQNRTQFVTISKEAGKLKGEMGTLRGLISELMASLGSAAISASIPEPRHLDQSSVTQARKAANRSSVANLDAIWNAQLFTLWKKVEGSQKFLPALPGRHIKHESGHWVELNAATWRPRRHVHMILLNDHLLIATWKKRRVDSSVINSEAAQGSSKLVADKCFALQDIDIFDLASSSIANDMGKSGRSEMANAISVRIGGDSYTYRSDKAAETDKAELLLTFRRAADELSRISRAEAEEASSRSRGNLDPPVTNGSVAAKSPSTPRLKDYPEILVEVDGKHQNMRWVEGQIDELDSAIALQQFERAVQHVEKLQGVAKGLKSNAVAQKTMVTRIDDRATKNRRYNHVIAHDFINGLPSIDLVVKRLLSSSQHLTYTQSNIAWLVRLGFDEKARETYLSSRSTTVSQRNSPLHFRR